MTLDKCRIRTLGEWHMRVRQKLRDRGWPEHDIPRRAEEIMLRAFKPEWLEALRASKIPPEEAEGYDTFPFREGDRVEVIHPDPMIDDWAREYELGVGWQGTVLEVCWSRE